MMAYSEVINEKNRKKDGSFSNEDMGIKLKNLKKFMLCVFRLALQSTPEIMLDYPLDKLAQATAEKCFENTGVTDKAKGIVNLNQVTKFIETANTMSIFSPPEGNDPSKIRGEADEIDGIVAAKNVAHKIAQKAHEK